MSIQQIYLYGHLAEQFGDVLPIKADSVRRALEVIEANFLRVSRDRGH